MLTLTTINNIKEEAAITEKTGTLSSEILHLIYDEKLFKVFLPIELGGRMMELPEAIRIFQKASSIDGSFGWLVTIGSGGNMFVPFIDEQVAESLFNVPNAVIAGSGYPTGSAVKTDGGYIVSGEWKYCSGANFASFFTANSLLFNEGEEKEEIISCIFMPEQVVVVEDWGAFGLKGTGSHTIQVDGVFVPDHHTFNMGKKKNDFGGFVHTFPFVQFSQASFAAVCLGITQDFLRKASEIMMNRTTSNTSHYEMILERIRKGQQVFNESEQCFYHELQLLWQLHIQGIKLEETELQQFSENAVTNVGAIIQMVNQLVRYMGMEAIMEGGFRTESDLEKLDYCWPACFSDSKVILSHEKGLSHKSMLRLRDSPYSL